MAETKADRARCSVREIAWQSRVQRSETEAEAAEVDFTLESENGWSRAEIWLIFFFWLPL